MDYRKRQALSDAPTFFYAPSDAISGNRVVLRGEESRHAATVCRLAAGQRIVVIDGKGSAFQCVLEAVSTRETTARIVEHLERVGEDLFEISLAFGVSRPQTADWVVEKATELGVTTLLPYGLGRNAPDLDRRIERWHRLVLAATKQSLRSVIPGIRTVDTIDSIFLSTQNYDLVIVAEPGGKHQLGSESRLPGHGRVLLVIGPEEGLTESELDSFQQQGARFLRLGPRRLRAETAAIVALTELRHFMAPMEENPS